MGGNRQTRIGQKRRRRRRRPLSLARLQTLTQRRFDTFTVSVSVRHHELRFTSISFVAVSFHKSFFLLCYWYPKNCVPGGDCASPYFDFMLSPPGEFFSRVSIRLLRARKDVHVLRYHPPRSGVEVCHVPPLPSPRAYAYIATSQMAGGL